MQFDTGTNKDENVAINVRTNLNYLKLPIRTMISSKVEVGM